MFTGDGPRELVLARECRLRELRDEHGTVRWQNVDLAHATVQRCLKDDMELTHLGFELGSTARAVLDTRGVVTKLELLGQDALAEGNEDALARQDAETRSSAARCASCSRFCAAHSAARPRRRRAAPPGGNRAARHGRRAAAPLARHGLSVVSVVTLAFLHHAAAFVIVGVLTAELVLLGGELTPTSARSILRMDAAYGIAAAVLLDRRFRPRALHGKRSRVLLS